MKEKTAKEKIQHIETFLKPGTSNDSWVLFEIESRSGLKKLNLPIHSMFIMNRSSYRIIYMGEIKSFSKLDLIENFLLSAIWRNQTIPKTIYMPRGLTARDYSELISDIDLRITPRLAHARPDEAFHYFVLIEAQKRGITCIGWENLREIVMCWNEMQTELLLNEKGDQS